MQLYRSKEISWLSFNARVLQEARDPQVPLLERIKFLGIYSSNMDEFFRVRVATLKRLSELGKDAKKLIGENPKKVLKQVQKMTIELNDHFDAAYKEIVDCLKAENILIVNEQQLKNGQGEFVKTYFQQHVRRHLFPVMLNQVKKFPELREHFIYLAICLHSEEDKSKAKHALIEIPTDKLSRFLILPKYRNKNYLILLDDIIRYNLKEIFSIFNFTQYDAYTIKLTRDAELDIEDDLSQSVIKKISRGLKNREQGEPVRFIYDTTMPEELLNIFVEELGLGSADTLIAGSRYHNFKDLINFPDFGAENLKYKPINSIPHKDIPKMTSLFQCVENKDFLLHYPYQSFNHVIDMLREASIDPEVISIRITIYRVAKDSSVMNALINAVKNGKFVVAVLELQARFDEESNIYWANRLSQEGVKVIYGVPGLKVHCKLCLITRKKKSKTQHFAMIGTGNFNENTARLYCDHILFTQDHRLTSEVQKIFEFFETNYNVSNFKHLIVSPFNMRKKISKLIRTEIKNALNGEEASIKLKLNNLVDNNIVKLLYKASQSGVKVQLIVRSMFSVVPGIEGYSDHIEAISIVDKYLEHSRFYIFHNGGDAKVFITSADLMPRNIDRRVEVTCPIYNEKIRNELIDYFNRQWQDNQKARLLDEKLTNQIHQNDLPESRAQWAIYDDIKAIHLPD